MQASVRRAAVLRHELSRGADSLLDFVPRTNKNFTRPDHLRPVAELMAAAVRGEAIRAGVSVPPRHGKTETLLVHGVPWYLSFRPNAHVAYVTYEADLARDKSSMARDLAQAIGIRLRSDSKSKSHWRTPQGGGLFATGIGGPLTGHGFQLAIVDDPFKNREEAESPRIRQKVHEWFTSTLMTRMEPGSAVIVNMARWHPDDLIGRLEKSREIDWNILNLSAINDNRALWPARWGLEALDVRRREVGPYDWASLFMGMPRPRGAQLFPVDGRFPARYTLPDVLGARGAIICDPAGTAKTSSDHTAIGVFAATGVGVNCRMQILEMVRMQQSMTKVTEVLGKLQRKWGYRVGFEAVAGFKAVPDMMRTLDPMLDIFEVPALGDKFTRALPAAAAWMDERIEIPADERPWTREYLEEMETFTGVGDQKDDQVDCTAHAWNELYREAPSYQGQVIEAIGY